MYDFTDFNLSKKRGFVNRLFIMLFARFQSHIAFTADILYRVIYEVLPAFHGMVPIIISNN